LEGLNQTCASVAEALEGFERVRDALILNFNATNLDTETRRVSIMFTENHHYSKDHPHRCKRLDVNMEGTLPLENMQT
jgi:hypothetical protein